MLAAKERITWNRIAIMQCGQCQDKLPRKTSWNLELNGVTVNLYWCPISIQEQLPLGLRKKVCYNCAEDTD